METESKSEQNEESGIDINNKVLAAIAVGLLVSVAGASFVLIGGDDEQTMGQNNEQTIGQNTDTTGVSGVVEAESPLSGVGLTAVGPGGDVVNTATTGADGGYSMEAPSGSTIVASIDGRELGAENPVYASAVQQAGSETVDFDLSQVSDGASTRTVDGEMVTIAYAGAGTRDDPYMIANAYQLQGMAADISAHYKLAQPIDAAETASWNDGAGFAPISGFSSTKFAGSLDGDGHAITQLTINRPEKDNVGLISFSESGTVESVDFVDADITASASTGVAVGYNAEQATIRGVHVTGTVSAPDKTGGLAGYNAGEIIASSSTADVSHPEAHAVGGLVGFQVTSGSITQSYATGDVSGYDDVGGLVGHTFGYVSDSYANGSVVGDTDVGGFTGKNGQGDRVLNGTIENSYANVDVTARQQENPAGGFIGFNHHSSQVENSYWNKDVETQNVIERTPRGISNGNVSVDVNALKGSKMEGGSYESGFESDLIENGPYKAVAGANPVIKPNSGN